MPGEESVASTMASDCGAGPLGSPRDGVEGTLAGGGIATPAGDEFSGGPTVPMMSGTWDPGGEAGEGKMHSAVQASHPTAQQQPRRVSPP